MSNQELDIDLDFGIMGKRSVTVSYSYQPAIKECFEHPGEPENYDIHSVTDDYGKGPVDLCLAIDYEQIVDAIKSKLEWEE